jgi:DNA-directed RNA polymerase specialized sigma subunit
MAGKIESTQPLRSAYDYCLDCSKGVDIQGVKDMSLPELNEARTKCSNCRSSSEGIYKTDAIATAIDAQIKVKNLEAEIADLQYKNALLALELQEKPRFAPYRGGKGETYFKRYGATVANLRAEGKTQKQISEILGISISSVNKICKKL